jgi:hypothetical protein
LYQPFGHTFSAFGCPIKNFKQLTFKYNHMKKQIALVLTLAALLVSACDDENPVTPAPPSQPRPDPSVLSIHPNVGASGSTMAIFGENFAPAISDNYVTFGSTSAEVVYVSYGVLTVRVPNLQEGDYEININSGGQFRRAPQMFTISNSQD